jgi:hypothetical protein
VDPGAILISRRTEGVLGMNLYSRGLMIGALTLILLTSACNLPAQTPVGTMLPTQVAMTVSPTVAVSTETPITLIPVTGAGDVSLQCQFCVNDEPHAVLILPESAAFLVSQPVVGVNCITAQVVADKRILFCRGAQQTVFTLNVCLDTTSCLQYPITLATCPLAPQSANLTPAVLTPVIAGATPTAAVTGVVSSPPPMAETPAAPSPMTATSPPAVATTALPLPTPTLPAVATTTAQPTAGTATIQGPQSRVPATHLPRTALNTPEGFLRWYFSAVWNEQNYQDLWDNYLTSSFKSRPDAGGYEGYAAWWDSVQRVGVNSVTVLQNDGTHAWVRVNITFTMKDGRVISNQEYDYDLLYDATRQTWMFDYRIPSTP